MASPDLNPIGEYDLSGEFSFVDFPEDVQLTILSFLSPTEISNFCLTSKRFAPLFQKDSKLWFSLCHRNWGSKIHLKSWSRNGRIPFHLLYKSLHRLDCLIGFWRHIDHHHHLPSASAAAAESESTPPSLVFFEWLPSSIVGYRISGNGGSYEIHKRPFLWIGLSPLGEPLCYLHALVKVRSEWIKQSLREADAEDIGELVDLDVARVSLSFVGKHHLVVEETTSGRYGRGDPESLPDSPPDHLTSEVYQYFANRSSSGWHRAYSKQRRRERLRQGKLLWEAEHYVKIVDANPTPDRPLQGLWKGLDMDVHMDLELCFYVVTYDDIGGIACRRLGDSKSHFYGQFSPVFWTSSTSCLEPPFSADESIFLNDRGPVKPFRGFRTEKDELPTRIIPINSSYDLVIPSLANTLTSSSRNTEGRIWQFKDGTFSFGFLQDQFRIEMWPVVSNGCLLDVSVD